MILLGYDVNLNILDLLSNDDAIKEVDTNYNVATLQLMDFFFGIGKNP